jgi:hypothetical protein
VTRDRIAAGVQDFTNLSKSGSSMLFNNDQYISQWAHERQHNECAGNVLETPGSAVATASPHRLMRGGIVATSDNILAMSRPL